MQLLQSLEAGSQIHHLAITLYSALGLGRLYLETGNLAAAQTHLGEVVTITQGNGFKTFELAARALLAAVGTRGGELDGAATHLLRAQEILSNGEDWRGLAAEVHLAEGIVATAQRRWPEAEAAFRKAAAISGQYHVPYYEARFLLEWGEMYLSRNGPGDRDKGMELLDQALATFQRIQAKKMVEKVLGRKELLKA